MQAASNDTSKTSEKPDLDSTVSDEWKTIVDGPPDESSADKHHHFHIKRLFGHSGSVQNRKGFFRKAVLAISKNPAIRYILYLLPITILIWIPGIAQLVLFHNAKVWDVKLFYWSIYLTVAYLGYFACMGAGNLLIPVLQWIIDLLVPGLRHAIEYLSRLQKWIMLTVWCIIQWVAFNVIVNGNGQADKSHGSGQITNQIVRAWFALVLVSLFLIGEKMIILNIARSYHRTSFETRILSQQFEISVLTKLYAHSHDVGDLGKVDSNPDLQSMSSKKMWRSLWLSAKHMAEESATPLGLAATELTRERLLQPNSPELYVLQALTTQRKSRMLARRIFYSFKKSEASAMHRSDIAHLFDLVVEAEEGFAFFDKDDNGDATLEEIEQACVELHRDRLALSSSMRDLDEAIGKFDGILMVLVWIIAACTVVGLLDTSLHSFIASIATLVLGLSWMIGTTAQEILLACIFVFAKHPYDAGDKIQVDVDTYSVKKVNLLSTVLQRADNAIVQMPHTLLNTKVIINYRRSGALAERIVINVDYCTPFVKIEDLRSKMLEFLRMEKRDFLPIFDISVTNLTNQSSLELTAEIRYKSSWQNTQLQIQRRNRWMCALRLCMAQLHIFGPGSQGDPAPAPAPQLVQMVTGFEPVPTADSIPADTPAFAVQLPAFTNSRDTLADAVGNAFAGSQARQYGGVDANPALMRAAAIERARLDEVARHQQIVASSKSSV